MTIWKIKPVKITGRGKPLYRIHEYTDDGRIPLRTLGPVRNKIKAIGIIAKLTAAERQLIEESKP